MVPYQKYQNKNEQSTAYNKWYGRAVINQTVGTDELADIIQRNASVKKSDVKAVLCELSEVVADQLGAGKRVVLDGIGAFKVGISTIGAETPEKFTVQGNIKGVRVIFQPETHVTSDGKHVKEMVKNVRLVEDNAYLQPKTPDEEPEP